MATTRTKRIIEIDVTTSKGVQSGVKQINAQLRSIEGNSKKAAREVTRVTRSFNLLALAAKAYIALRIARSVTDLSDSMILLGARVNIVTEETVGLERAMDDLFDVATLTRQTIETTGTLYARLGFATKALNLEHQDLLDIVQGVNNTLLLSGASAQESASSIIQLSQAFSKGSLDGDEFRSVSEGNVILFGIMQEVLGKTAKELRQFSRDGKLSADILAEVLTSQQVKDLQGRVDEIPFTFAQAFILIRNELAKLARDFEEQFASITESIVESVRDFTVLKRFYDAIQTGAIKPPENFIDIFDFEEITRQVEELEKSAGEGGVAAFNRIKAVETDIELLTKRIEFLVDRYQRAQDTLAQPLPFGLSEESFLGGAIQERRQSFFDTIAKSLRDTNAEAIRLSEQLERLTSPAKSPLPPPEDTARTFSKYEESVLKLEAAFDQTLDNIVELDELFQSGAINGDVYAAEVDRIEKSLLKSADAADKAEKEIDEFGVAIGNVLASGVEKIGDTLFDLAIGLEASFRQTFESILEDIGRLIVKLTLLNALKATFAGTSFGEFLFPTANAKGNVFDQGRVIPFATGGVIDSPVLFPMASGAGIAGEDGPEAILPLKRGSDGKLGVTAEGGGAAKNVTVSIENRGTESEVVSSTASADINGTVVNIILDDFRRGGPLHTGIKGLTSQR